MLSNVEVKIAEDGEILVRGPNVMKGYFNSPELTNEAIDSEGWFHTGDIGIFEEHGYLKITDRKKNIIVSSGGKNITPTPIENLLFESRFVDQILIIGDNRPFLTALIVPNIEFIKEFALSKNMNFGNLNSIEELKKLLDNDIIILTVEADIKRLQKDLSTFEKVRKIELLPEPFTVENGMMTPTLKIKRKIVELNYNDLIDNLYKEIDLD